MQFMGCLENISGLFTEETPAVRQDIQHPFILLLSDVPGALAEITRVLKPGGMVVQPLSTGKIGTTENIGLEHYQSLPEEHVVPGMPQSGCKTASIKNGPASRQFKTVALVALR